MLGFRGVDPKKCWLENNPFLVGPLVIFQGRSVKLWEVCSYILNVKQPEVCMDFPPKMLKILPIGTKSKKQKSYSMFNNIGDSSLRVRPFWESFPHVSIENISKVNVLLHTL